MQHLSALPSHSPHDIKEKFRIKTALNEHAKRYSDARIEQVQVTQKKPPVPATASSRPATKAVKNESNGTLLCVSEKKTPYFVSVCGEHKAIQCGDSRTDFALSADKYRDATMQQHPEQFKLLPVKEAAQLWLEEKKLHSKKPRTIEAYGLYIKNLIRHMGNEKLCGIHIGHFLTYQQIRRKEGACASYVNHETNTLAQILRRADLWDLIEKHYRPLPVGNWTPPKVLTAEEEERFFRVAASNPEWQVAYWAVSLTNNTSALGTELRHLQLKHVFLDHNPPKIHIPDQKVKNEFRARVIPLNEVAEKQVRRIVERAKKLGAYLPEHHIFPFRVNRGTWDATRPASRSFIKKAFAAMREATGLDWLQPRNFRNQIITKLFEAGAPDETITSIAGHQSIRMSQHYSRIRLDKKFEVLSAIVPKGKGAKNAG